MGVSRLPKKKEKKKRKIIKGFVLVYKLFWAWLGFGPAEKEEKENERVRLVC